MDNVFKLAPAITIPHLSSAFSVTETVQSAQMVENRAQNVSRVPIFKEIPASISVKQVQSIRMRLLSSAKLAKHHVQHALSPQRYAIVA